MLRISRYRFKFHAQDTIQFPPFPGSALRGIFGHGLKRSVCVTRLSDCSECVLRSHCVYSYLFETHLSIDKRESAPQPLVLDVHRLQRRYDPGEAFTVEATLIGNAYRNFPYLIQAWQRAGQRGVGRGNARFELDQADVLDFQSSNWQQIFPAAGSVTQFPEPYEFQAATEVSIPDQVNVRLVTPYRGKRNGRLVTPESFDIKGFMVSLLRRISRLQELHDADCPGIDLPLLIDAASNLTITNSDLRWKEWTRHSSRQHTHMNMGGVVGAFTLSGEGMRQLWPGLQLGQWIQAGKNTLFGLGRYKI